jgi:hypothetical protein
LPGSRLGVRLPFFSKWSSQLLQGLDLLIRKFDDELENGNEVGKSGNWVIRERGKDII